MDARIAHWQQMIERNTELAEQLESGKMQVFSGPRIDEGANQSTEMAANLRRINADLQKLVDKYQREDA